MGNAAQGECTPGSVAGAAPATVASAKGHCALDVAATLEGFDGDQELLREIAGLFLSDAPRLLSQIQSAVSRGDQELLERAAHALKGAVSNFSAAAAVEKAARLEEMARGCDLSGAAEVCAALEAELKQLALELDAFVREGEACLP